MAEEVGCPRAPQCPGVLRYALADRTHGYITRCEPTKGGGPFAHECGGQFWWDAQHEEWRPFGRR